VPAKSNAKEIGGYDDGSDGPHELFPCLMGPQGQKADKPSYPGSFPGNKGAIVLADVRPFSRRLEGLLPAEKPCVRGPRTSDEFLHECVDQQTGANGQRKK